MTCIKATAIVLGLLFVAGTAQEAYASTTVPDDNFILVRRGGGGGGGGRGGGFGGGGRHVGGGGRGHIGHGHVGHGHVGHGHVGHGHIGRVGAAVGTAAILGAPYYGNYGTSSTYICAYDAYGNPQYCQY